MPPRNRRDQQQQHRHEDEAELAQERAAVELCIVLAEDQRRSEDEQDVRDDASRHRAAHDVGQIVADGDHGDDDLGRVSEARVQQAADARAGMFSCVFGGFPD